MKQVKEIATGDSLFPDYPHEFVQLFDYIKELDQQPINYDKMRTLLYDCAKNQEITIDWHFDWNPKTQEKSHSSLVSKSENKSSNNDKEQFGM